ncbi:MAG: carbohydrate ABC transporter permease [Alphaproteobacteria bacterium]|nr:carbohydrate ABC transporter permease [Alphaproteobacteria bacterium]
MSADPGNRLVSGRALETTATLLACAVIIVPIYWILSNGFKSLVDVFALKWVFTPTLENFQRIFAVPFDIGQKLLNSAIVSLLAVAIAIPVATLAAYAFSRFALRGARALVLAIVFSQFIPPVVIVLPYFVLFRDLGLYDTRIGLALIELALVTPFAVLMLKSYIDQIPREIEEAAVMDGATRLRIIADIVAPLAAPGIITAALLCFILTWNDFLFALILTSKDAVTLPVGLAMFGGEEGVLWHLISAGGTLLMIPMLVLSIRIQKYYLEGTLAGANK